MELEEQKEQDEQKEPDEPRELEEQMELEDHRELDNFKKLSHWEQRMWMSRKIALKHHSKNNGFTRKPTDMISYEKLTVAAKSFCKK